MTRVRAFTLIELTLVTVIILSLVGLSIPLFRKTFAALSAKDAVFNISKLVSYAQERAVIDRKNYRITFDFNRRTYQLFESNSSAEGIVYVKGDKRFGKVFFLPQGLFFRDAKTGVTQKTQEEYKKHVLFYPDGHCDELSLEVVDAKGNGYSVAVKGFGFGAGIKEVIGEE
ncbi:MAG: hypothetical protein PHS46_07180 [Candidatus Omnitrophica bacterium]|jgi:Tfp pilus assembly protein FimT|nr:hypothetical protein [Candidatus Omnitrophota bacterium]